MKIGKWAKALYRITDLAFIIYMFSTFFYIGHTNTNIDIQRWSRWYGLTSKILICQLYTLSYIIPWRSGSYTCFSNRSVAKNMADFGLCRRQIHAIWYLRLQVMTTDQAQFWSRLNFHTLLVFCRILFCFLSFRGIKFCSFFSVFSMFSGRLTICLSICKF